MSGKIETITAEAVILCTGGCGRVFPFTTNAAIKNGDGMALAYRAGAPLKDMEFVQYHPTGLPFTGILITEAARAEGGWLLNKDGYRYLQDYNLGKPEPRPVLRSMELGPRDRLSQAFVKEVEKGRTIDTPYGPSSISTSGTSARRSSTPRLPFVRELCLKYREHRSGQGAHPGPAGRALHDGRRPHRHPRRDSAGRVVRSGRGRLRQHQRREPPRLEFAAGTAGLRCARRSSAAAEYASGARTDPGPAVLRSRRPTRSGACDMSSCQDRRHASASPRSATRCRRPWRRAPVSTAPATRSAGRRHTLRSLRERFARRCRRRPQPDLQHRDGCGARVGLHARRRGRHRSTQRCSREESRGAHQRTDFPARDDSRFLAHSLIYRTADGSSRVEYSSGDDHPLAPGRAGLREVAATWPTASLCR